MQERLKRRVGGKGGEDEEGGIIDRLNRLRIILSICFTNTQGFSLGVRQLLFYIFHITIVLVYMCPRCQFKLREIVHPVPAPLSTKDLDNNITRAGIKNQNLILFIRGKAISLAPPYPSCFLSFRLCSYSFFFLKIPVEGIFNFEIRTNHPPFLHQRGPSPYLPEGGKGSQGNHLLLLLGFPLRF
jgi:hypothetical protein